MAYEILKTNRQISNIEKKIEEFTHQIKWIQSTLQEKDNLEKSTLIKEHIVSTKGNSKPTPKSVPPTRGIANDSKGGCNPPPKYIRPTPPPTPPPTKK